MANAPYTGLYGDPPLRIDQAEFVFMQPCTSRALHLPRYYEIIDEDEEMRMFAMGKISKKDREVRDATSHGGRCVVCRCAWCVSASQAVPPP